MKTKNHKNTKSTRLIFRGGRVSNFRDPSLAYLTWLSLPRGTCVAFRGPDDTRPVQAWDFADRPK